MRTLPRRAFLVAGVGCSRPRVALQVITVQVQLLFDLGAHDRTGLTPAETSRLLRHQQTAALEFSGSGIRFDLRTVGGAYLRKQGYSQIPDRFLARDRINLFVTDSLGYDIDRDRTGGCSIGPPYYKIFLGLRDAGESTLLHEYAHHFTGDTRANPTAAGNLWSDLRNDYWIRRQRAGAAIEGFRACLGAPWTHL